MIRLYSILMSLFTFEHSSSFLSASGGIWGFFATLGKYLLQWGANLFAKLGNFLKEASWAIIKFVLGITDAFQFMIEEFLGIRRDSDGMMHGITFDEMVNYAEETSVGATSFVSVLTTTFRAIVAVSIVLLIIFTIIAIVRQEYTAATQAASDSNSNDKKPIIMGLFKKMLYIILLPLTMIFIITGVNSILAAFSRAMSGQVNMTIASQILATSTYDSNKYRYYAQQDRRVPIVINTYDPDDYDPDENDLLVQKIESIQVQNALKDTALNIKNKNLLSFKDALTYKNNKLTNSVEYGDYYEKFICTPEQYQVMADFVDYAQKTNLNFQIRALDDESIEWKYVDSAVFNPNDVSLKINYHDNNDLNNNGSVSDSYTIEYSASYEVTSPITDSMTTIMALLGIDEYADNLYKTMERDENYVNLVNWTNEKVLIQLSDSFVLNNPSTWNRIDQLIMYEYYHFASNNTFGDYSIQDLIDGVELDAAQIVYREYYPDANAYSAERTRDCVKINGSYYNTVKDPYKTDSYGNVYYVLQDSLTEADTLSFLNNEYSRIEKVNGSVARLLLTGRGSGFNLNDPSTWSYSDQILIYEFFSDLTYNNMLYIYDFSEFMGTDSNNDTVLDKFIDVPVYKITHSGIDGTTEKTDLNGIYVLLNGTYYKVKSAGTDAHSGKTLYSLWGDKDDTTANFVAEATPYIDKYYYNYEINLDADVYEDAYGISTNASSSVTAANIIKIGDEDTVFEPLEQDDENFVKYSSFSLKFSNNFNFADVDTWTYKDYFIFYLYANYPKIAGNLGIDALRISGVNGDIGTIGNGGTYVMQVKYGKSDDGEAKDLYLYIDIDKASVISDMLINKELNSVNLGTLMSANRVDNTNELFVNVDIENLKTADSEVHKFYFSDGFHEKVPGSWTVLDYILYTFSIQEKISSVSDIKENGYSSVKYILANDVVYQLGSSADKTYLSLNGINALVDIENNSLNFLKEKDFLNLPLIDYIAKLYRTTRNSLVTDEEGVVDALYQELTPYIYDVDSIIEEILNKNGYKLDSENVAGSPNKFELFENVSEFTYTSSAKVEDMSTWTKFDELIYGLTGSFPSSYTSKVISYDGKKYFVIGNYAIDISSSDVVNPSDPDNTITNPFISNLTDKNKITSLSTSFVEGVDSIEVYYNNRYKDKVITKFELKYKNNSGVHSNFDNTYAKLTGDELELGVEHTLNVVTTQGKIYIEVYNSSTNKYFYVEVQSYSENAIVSVSQPSIIDGLKVTDYANTNFTYTKDTVADVYTAFDIIYTYLTDTNAAFPTNKTNAIAYGQSVSYDVYSVNDTLYIEIYNATKKTYYYVEVTEKYGNEVSVVKQSEIKPVDTAKIAQVDTTTFTSFNNTIDEESTNLDLKTLNYTKIDAIIYSLTGEMVSRTYTVYKRGEKLYSYIGNQYVLINEDIIENKNPDQNAASFSEIHLSNTTHEIEDDVVTELYNKYYKNYRLAVVNSIITSSSEDVTYTYKKSDETLDITNLSPLTLILAKEGLINLGSSEETTIQGTVVSTQRGKEYFYFNDSLNAKPLQFYVDITDIAHTYRDSQETEDVALVDNAIAKYEMVLRYMLMNNGVSQSEYISNYIGFQTEMNTLNSAYAVEKETLKTTLSNVDGFEIISPTNWTFYNILAYNLSGNESLDDTVFVYTDASNNTYVEIANGSNSIFLQISAGGTIISNLFTKFDVTPVNYVKQNESGEYTPLGIIASKATDLDEGAVDEVTVSADLKFYFVVDNYNGTYSAVYGLNNASIRSKATNGNYTYVFKGDDEILNWSILDALIALIANNVSESAYVSQIHIYGSNAYFEVNQNYINITKIGALTDAYVDSIYDKIGTDDDINVQIVDNTAKLRDYYNSTDEGNSAVVVIDNINSLVATDDESEDVDESEKNKVYFSEDFDISDFTTWTHADLVLYYMFMEYSSYFSNADKTISNFQELVEQGYVPAYEFNHIVDDGKGNTTIDKVLWIGIDDEGGSGVALNKAVFQTYYNRAIVNFEAISDRATLKYNIGVEANAQNLKEINIAKNIALNTNDFIYENYYYFTLTHGYRNKLLATEYSEIAAGKGVIETTIDIALREGFDITEPSSWTWLEFIVIYEYSNQSVRHNFFEGMSFEDLKTTNYLPVFHKEGGSEFIIEINGNYYNLNKIQYAADAKTNELSDEEVASILQSKIQTEKDDANGDLTVDDAVYKSTDKNSQMSVLYETYEYMVKKENDYALDYSKTPETILFEYTSQSSTGKNLATFEYNGNSYSFYIDSTGAVSFDDSTRETLTPFFGENFSATVNIYDYKLYIGVHTFDYSLTESGTLYYLSLNTDIIQTYTVNFASLNCNNNYTITNIVREVNWPQKLMNDIQTIYPDLNWSTLLATDGWLDTLGVFTSAQASGEFETEGNSANITAAGLVLSEFFLSVIKQPEDYTTYLDYEYVPVFDENTIKSLMLAMLGEEEYNDLSMQATVFMDMFNELFVPVLEDIANERGIELVDGKVDNFYISVYKAYLATVLLSSDMAEYFYKIATRVYAQYTILDALASASGDYAAYLNYINTLSGVDGDSVTSFNYANFHKLTLYENSFSGNANPTFTFNIYTTVKGLYGSGVTYRDLAESGYSITTNSTGNENSKITQSDVKKIFENEANFDRLVERLDSQYESIYITSNSRVKDSNETGYYCYLFDAYWSIKQELESRNVGSPTYLANYHEYLLGEIDRWYHVSDVSIEQASAYIPNQTQYEMSRDITSMFVELAGISIYAPDPDQFEVEEGENLWDTITNVLGSALETLTTNTDTVLKATFRDNSNLYSDYRRAYENVFTMSDMFIGNDVTGILKIMNESKKGDTTLKYSNKVSHQKYEKVDAWNRLLCMRDDLEILVNELGAVMETNPGSYVEGDNTRGFRSAAFDEERYQKAYEEIQEFYSQLDSYIANQKIIDIIYKTSITFTLAQYGKNYVTEGYSFEYENKSYTLKSSASPERLAEYVYGGSFLARYGVSAIYTNSEYNGFVENYRVYDSESASIKTHLNVWTEMRTFASELANYTAKLYYLSNMNDLSGNVGDALLLTDTVYKGKSSGTEQVDRTLEHMILEYILDSDLSADTLLRLIFGDTSISLDDLIVDVDKDIYALAYYLEGTHYTEDSDIGNKQILIDGTTYEMSSSFKRNALYKYLELVANDASYDSFGYYHDGSNTGAERIHIIFKKVISYLVVTEEEGESVSADAVKLDDITFKDFRKLLIKTLADYQKNPSETDLENSNRYITLFNLICSQFSYSYKGGSSDYEVGTTVSSIYLKHQNDRANYIHKTNTGEAYLPLYADFSIDVPTRDIILTLAGIENRPIEELVGLEYDSLYDTDEEYDEADGDTFIVCTYDEMEGLYYPVIARNPDADVSDRHYEYIQKYNIDVTTRYIESDYCYPIVARGVIDAEGNPTAIKISNNTIVFYRTGITGSTTVGEGALSYTRSGGEVTTVGYTKYVPHSYSNAKGTEKMAMFAGSSNIDTVLNSKYQIYFIQVDDMYSIGDETNFDAISVLDQFSAFYTLETKQYAMFILGFATIIPMLFKASAAVLRRVLDLIFLVLMGPVAIASTAISPEKDGQSNSKIFTTWKNYLTQTLLHVFGYIIAFNIYYILVSTVMNMDLVSDNTMDMIYRVGGLSQIITKDSVNSFMRLVYTLCAAGALETSADLLVKIVTAGKADSAFSTPMSKDVMGEVKKVVQEVKAKAQMAKNFINGKVIVQAKDFALETAKNLVPGSAIVRGAIHKGQDIASDFKGKALEKLATAYKVPPAVAKKLGKQYAENEKKQRVAKRQKSTKNANEFLGNFGVGPMYSQPEDAPKSGGKKGGGSGGKKKKAGKKKGGKKKSK